MPAPDPSCHRRAFGTCAPRPACPAPHPLPTPSRSSKLTRRGVQTIHRNHPRISCSSLTHDRTRLHPPTFHPCSVAAALDRSTPGRAGMLCPIEPSDNALHNCASGLICVPLPHVRMGLGQGRGAGCSRGSWCCVGWHPGCSAVTRRSALGCRQRAPICNSMQLKPLLTLTSRDPPCPLS